MEMETLIYILAGLCALLGFAAVLALLRSRGVPDIRGELARFEQVQGQRMEEVRRQQAQSAAELRQEVVGLFKALGDSAGRQIADGSRMNAESMDRLRAAVETKLRDISDMTERRLEQMRRAVDEQLSDTLQKRLTGSFKQVSDQLEQVFKSMGEVRSLATGVGDLKRMLSNVKVRGTWGEMQLGCLISSMLSPVQYVSNASVREGRERVEYAVVLPGRGDDTLLLPIDSKFPMEAYITKEDVLALGDKTRAREAMKALSAAIVTEAKRIRDKYINPPVTTDFAVMYLPTEGLYADAIAMGVFDVCQREYHVIISGPSTLTALLSSLQMGFKTLAIEKQSGEVMRLLEAVRKAFSGFSVALEKTQKSLYAAQNNLDDASRRSRTIEKQLDRVSGVDACLAEENAAGG
jgi:DNA recombination protein RmuC